MTRVAVLEKDRCINGKGCDYVCGNVCPVNLAGKECITLPGEGEASVARLIPLISEELCIGCNLCVIKCPVDCIYIENLVQELNAEEIVHRFGENAFRFYRLPSLRNGSVTGLIGRNGIGKSTILWILSGQLVPNLGNWKKKGSYGEVIKFFRGKEIQNYFTSFSHGEISVSYKPQNILLIPKAFSGEVRALLEKAGGGRDIGSITEMLGLGVVLERDLSQLSGGELQRVAIAAACLKDADVYAFDEPSSFLDVRERLNAAKLIRNIASVGKMVMVVEHDLAVLDYLSDYINIVYGKKSVYGIVSNQKSVRNGINEFLGGFVKDENVRFRKEELRFGVRPALDYRKNRVVAYYPRLEKHYKGFSLKVEEGELHEGEVLGILGPNGIGKTTFVKMLAGVENPDAGELGFAFAVSYKPQYLKPELGVTVGDFVGSQDIDKALFNSHIDKRLAITELENHYLDELSGGELQKVAVGVSLARSRADLILLDEPSAFVDVEDRLNLADTVRGVVDSQKKICMVVDHDILFQDYVSDRLLVFEGEPSTKGRAGKAVPMREGMNAFLKSMGITYRRDPESGRPRANKLGSQLDEEQKEKGEYYYVS